MHWAWGPDRRSEEQKKAGPRGPDLAKPIFVAVATAATAGAGTGAAVAVALGSEALDKVKENAEKK